MPQGFLQVLKGPPGHPDMVCMKRPQCERPLCVHTVCPFSPNCPPLLSGNQSALIKPGGCIKVNCHEHPLPIPRPHRTHTHTQEEAAPCTSPREIPSRGPSSPVFN